MRTQIFQLNDLVIEVSGMLHRVLDDSVALSTSMCPHAGVVRADRMQLQNAILRIAASARVDMCNGDRFVLETRPVGINDPQCLVHPEFACGEYARLSISYAWATMPPLRNRLLADRWHLSLASNEGIYVNMQDFKIAKGAAKGDPATQIAKAGARDAPDGTIIFRSGNKLYIADGKLPSQ
jgi:hypothetical protein